MSNFRDAISTVLAHEGGYVNDPADPGGETKYGISKRSYPNVDIKNLTVEQAKEIYRKDWWDKYKYERIENQKIATKIFDLSVNMGAPAAHKLLQQAVRAATGLSLTVDGILGNVSFGAINGAKPEVLLAALRSEAAGRYRLLAARKPEFERFLSGWLNRAYA